MINCLNPSSALEAQEGLRSIASILALAGPEHASMYDGLILRANTQYLFTPNKYSCFASNPVRIPGPDSKAIQEMAQLAEVRIFVTICTIKFTRWVVSEGTLPF